ncbi:amino acid racemase [Patescibacteria group bacterium]|nr:amino acid racemase [Patescibacteria group bacterium]MBU2259278.1 amino acid racemase [Patescibacteria group bacterium]
MPLPQQTIGILGGMGPNASADFLQRILRISSKKYGAVQDDEYPSIVLNSIGLQGFATSGITNMPLVEQQLIQGVQFLTKAGTNIIAIPCNTVHCCYQTVQSTTPIPILHTAEITAAAVADIGISRIGLCSSVTTVQTKLYEDACAAKGIDVLVPSPNQQKIVNDIIESVMSGGNGEEELLQLKSVILGLQSQGAQGVILGCTELPLVINQKWTDVPLFDSLELLAIAATDAAYAADCAVV